MYLAIESSHFSYWKEFLIQKILLDFMYSNLQPMEDSTEDLTENS